jgi:hypothetical protein
MTALSHDQGDAHAHGTGLKTRGALTWRLLSFTGRLP